MDKHNKALKTSTEQPNYAVITKQMSLHGALRTGQGFCQNRKQGLELKLTM